MVDDLRWFVVMGLMETKLLRILKDSRCSTVAVRI